MEIMPIMDRLGIFDSFTADEKRQMVSEDAHFKVYQPEDRLIQQGSHDQSLFIILTGTVSIRQRMGSTTLAVLGEGDIFGEMAFFADVPRTADVIANDSVIALKLDRVLFDQLPTRIREKFKDKIIEKLVGRLDWANRELARRKALSGNENFAGGGSGDGLSRKAESESVTPVFRSGRKLIRKILSDTKSLPAMPGVMVKVQRMVKHPRTSPAQLAKVIQTDPAIVAGILKVANSAYYGFRGKVSTIQHASALFGTRRLTELITAMSAGNMMKQAMAGYGLKTGDMWRHSVAVACTAGEISAVAAPDVAESAYMAGLLHDVGKLILDPYVQERKILFDQYWKKHKNTTIQSAERDILGFDHAVIAAIVCENWNLPRAISFGIRHHHDPSKAGDHPLTHIVHLADYIVNQAGMVGDSRSSKRELEAGSLSIVRLDEEALQNTAEKARQYMESLTGGA